jgi:hypothetical protein
MAVLLNAFPLNQKMNDTSGCYVWQHKTAHQTTPRLTGLVEPRWTGSLVDAGCNAAEQRNVNPADTLTSVDRDRRGRQKINQSGFDFNGEIVFSFGYIMDSA